MVIECSSCHARFKLADDKIKESGTKVRCTKCREVFTVFPENPPPMESPAVNPVNTIVPVVAPQREMAEDSLPAVIDTSFAAAESSRTAVGLPVSAEDDWNQETTSDLFSDGFSEDAGASDLDAISFENIEAPVFSVSNGKDNKFEFSDDTALSFNDLSLENKADFPIRTVEASVEQSFSVTIDNDFAAADFDTPAPASPASADLGQPDALNNAGDFTFPEADNLADLSWDEPDNNPVATSSTEQIQDTTSLPQNTAFDFSSFSFDDADFSAGSEDNKGDESDFQSETTIELSLPNETEPAPDMYNPPVSEVSATPVAMDRQESVPRPAKPLRPRIRQKKKSTSRRTFKTLIIFLLILAAIYGIMNRDQIQNSYNNIVNNFIENQSRVETNGRIDLIKLSGSYVRNSQEGDLFVIRGEAVNEFKGLRSSVLVRGTIFGDSGVILQNQSAYCGNPLSDSSLKSLSFKQLRDVLSNELGENLVNMNIATGKSIPCTIVFNQVPKNITEFTVEVIDSKTGSK